MKKLRKKQIGKAVCTILLQLALTTPLNVVYSWGISNKVATQIDIMVDGVEKTVAALMMDVNGFNYRGRLYVTNDKAKQTFGLYIEQDGMLHDYLHILDSQAHSALIGTNWIPIFSQTSIECSNP